MKRALLLLFLSLGLVLVSEAQLTEWPKMKKLEFKELRTTSDRVLVAFYFGPDLNGISTDLSLWSLNGKQPEKIDKWITPNWKGIEFGYEHHIYLTMQEPFVQGKKYSLKTPYGEIPFTFNSKIN